MLYYLLKPFQDTSDLANLFSYITFRTAAAAIVALFISLILGPRIIKALRKWHMEEIIDPDTPARHQSKKGTPTMGGLIVLGGVFSGVLLFGDLTNVYVQVCLFATLWMGAMGYLDDYLKVIVKRPKGLVARYKFLGQILLGLAIGTYLLYYDFGNIDIAATHVPFTKLSIYWGWLFIPMVVFVITGFTNAVNLTDGLDGLATGAIIFAMSTFAIIAYVAGHLEFSKYLQMEYMPGTGEMTVFIGAIVGACMGFMWYNSHPAQVFLGDTGSLALGGALGTIAILLKEELLLLIIGGLFVAEALSVMIQVFWFKRTKKRVFKMAPIHHHFELVGWHEAKIVTRFLIIAAFLMVITLSTLKIR